MMKNKHILEDITGFILRVLVILCNILTYIASVLCIIVVPFIEENVGKIILSVIIGIAGLIISICMSFLIYIDGRN